MTKLIWDFNGTILNDVEAGFITINQMLEQRNKPCLESTEAYKKIFGFPIIDYYKRAGFDFQNESYDEIAQSYIPLYNKNARDAKLVTGITNLFDCCNMLKYEMFILSACEQTMLENYLKRYEISNYFKKVYGIDNHLAAGKFDAAKNLFNEIGNNNTVLIGDSVHDKEIADKFNVKCILVSWGHEDLYRLKKANNVVCKTVDELFDCLKKGI